MHQVELTSVACILGEEEWDKKEEWKKMKTCVYKTSRVASSQCELKVLVLSAQEQSSGKNRNCCCCRYSWDADDVAVICSLSLCSVHPSMEREHKKNATEKKRKLRRLLLGCKERYDDAQHTFLLSHCCTLKRTWFSMAEKRQHQQKANVYTV